MTDGAPDSAQPTVEQAALGPDGAAPPATVPAASPPPVAQPVSDLFDERPELAVGAAFAGGFVFALLLKRLAR